MSRSLDDLLTDAARASLAQARRMPLSYGVRTYACPGVERRLLVVLGEAHVKLGAASNLGREIVAEFSLRGVESFQKKQVLAGRALMVLIAGPRVILRLLSFGLVKGSTITDALNLSSGTTVQIERTKTIPIALHAASLYLAVFFLVGFTLLLAALVDPLLPKSDVWLAQPMFLLGLVSTLLQLHMLALIPAYVLRRKPWSWLIHPLVGIIATRDRLMAEGTVQMLEDHDSRTALVVMGRAHLSGFEAELVEKHGFRRLDR